MGTKNSTQSPKKKITFQNSDEKYGHWMGQILNERYEIQKFIGEGSFGSVFKVKDLKDIYEPRKALKLIHNQLEGDVLKEIEILEKTKSNYLVKYFGNFEDDMNLFIIFEFCSNGDLENKITLYKNKGDKIDDEKIKNWTLDILDGLDFLHTTLRVVHFDLKPANIFMGELDRCKIGDLGLARNHESLSKMSQMRGTLCYMSPELVTIEKDSKIDFKTDIWSFGCILYEMVTLEKAFFHENLLKLQLKIVECYFVIPDDVNDVLKEMIKLCIVKETERKYTSRDLRNKIKKHTSDLQNSLESNLK